jgi:hypothetical protein
MPVIIISHARPSTEHNLVPTLYTPAWLLLDSCPSSSPRHPTLHGPVPGNNSKMKMEKVRHTGKKLVSTHFRVKNARPGRIDVANSCLLE